MGRLQQLKQKTPRREIRRKQASSSIVDIGWGEPARCGAAWHDRIAFRLLWAQARCGNFL
jgi:hypothetical protein